MKCKVCGHDFPEGLGNCPRCNFANLVSLGKEQEAEITKMAETYRRIQLDSVKLSISLWEMKIESDGKIVPIKREKELGKCMDWETGAMIWTSEQITGEISTATAVELIAEYHGEKSYVSTPINLPEADSDWTLGVQRTQEGLIRVCLKNGANHVYSEPVNVL